MTSPVTGSGRLRVSSSDEIGWSSDFFMRGQSAAFDQWQCCLLRQSTDVSCDSVDQRTTYTGTTITFTASCIVDASAMNVV